ncbi:MAG TPA: hypothetical protein VMK12_28540, partial [Anaeromyxobacteraceae bacterium]|nr:hypothetical protein [Anaeromyxobacteraceae bacterium]
DPEVVNAQDAHQRDDDVDEVEARSLVHVRSSATDPILAQQAAVQLPNDPALALERDPRRS